MANLNISRTMVIIRVKDIMVIISNLIHTGTKIKINREVKPAFKINIMFISTALWYAFISRIRIWLQKAPTGWPRWFNKKLAWSCKVSYQTSSFFTLQNNLAFYNIQWNAICIGKSEWNMYVSVTNHFFYHQTKK